MNKPVGRGSGGLPPDTQCDQAWSRQVPPRVSLEESKRRGAGPPRKPDAPVGGRSWGTPRPTPKPTRAPEKISFNSCILSGKRWGLGQGCFCGEDPHPTPPLADGQCGARASQPLGYSKQGQGCCVGVTALVFWEPPGDRANGQLSSYRQHYSGSTKCLVEPEQGTLLIKKPDSHIFLVRRHLNGGRVSAHLTPST